MKIGLNHMTPGVAGGLSGEVWVAGQRFNGAALVNPSTIHTAAWGTGSLACTEKLDAVGAPTGYYEAAALPAVPVAAGIVTVLVIFREGASAPVSSPEVGRQSYDWDGTRVIGRDTIAELLLADRYIDKTSDPTHWALVLMRKGSGGIGAGTELDRKKLNDVNGAALASAQTTPGQQVAP